MRLLHSIVGGKVSSDVDIPALGSSWNNPAYTRIEARCDDKRLVDCSIRIETDDTIRLCAVVRSEVTTHIYILASIRGERNGEHGSIKRRDLVGGGVVGIIVISTTDGEQDQSGDEADFVDA